MNHMLKLYERQVTKRAPVNKFGRLGYVLVSEKIATEDIEKYNKRKHIKFKEIADQDVACAFIPDQVYETQLKVLSKTW